MTAPENNNAGSQPEPSNGHPRSQDSQLNRPPSVTQTSPFRHKSSSSVRGSVAPAPLPAADARTDAGPPPGLKPAAGPPPSMSAMSVPAPRPKSKVESNVFSAVRAPAFGKSSAGRPR